MEATLGRIEGYSHEDSRRLAEAGKALRNWVVGVFGCAHKEMSRPFSRHGENYRVCIGCGAHRRFDPQTWVARGPFYYKEANPSELMEVNSSALKSLDGTEARASVLFDPVVWRFLGDDNIVDV